MNGRIDWVGLACYAAALALAIIVVVNAWRDA